MKKQIFLELEMLSLEGSFALMIFSEHENVIRLRTLHSSVPIN